MPNGNVLLISYDVRSSSEAIQAGSSSSSTFWSEKIVEVKPTGATSGTIVWEWYLWDHLCQNHDASKDNYVTSIVDNPHLLNINYGGSLPDRYHMNGLDYNEDLDQIVMSMHNMDAAFVIDHSTTTAEAAGHTGGNSGMGGDYLYRWGNPSSWNASGSTIFDVIHDAHWITSDHPDFPDYLCGYNNKGGSQGKTAVDIWNPPYNGYNYSMTPGQATPSASAYQYTANFTANNEGNSQQLPNGNILINNFMGSIYEVDSDGTQLWTKSGAQSTHAYRYTKCYVRGPIASADISLGEICEGEQITLNSSAVSVTESNPTYDYNWESTATGFTSTSQNPTDNPTTSTTYIVTITNTDLGCSDTDSISVIVNALPEIPTISQNGNQLTSTPAISYQWYLDDSMISGATNQTYDAIVSGSYQVEITDANGCTEISAPYPFIYTAISQIKNEEFPTIYPNPTSGIIKIKNSQSNKVILRNSLGAVLETNMNAVTMDLSKYPEGIYYVSIVSENGSVKNYKVIKLK